jgi:hypothetical protein
VNSAPGSAIAQEGWADLALAQFLVQEAPVVPLVRQFGFLPELL